jgi:hypothetical protein
MPSYSETSGGFTQSILEMQEKYLKIAHETFSEPSQFISYLFINLFIYVFILSLFNYLSIA